MRIVTGVARLRGAARLIPVESAHLDGCLYHGQAGLDFVERLVESGGRVTVPTTLNVGSIDLLHAELVRAPADEATAARRLMAGYQALGARPTWTCAPYQVGHRPGRGHHVAWAESNAIAFCNSVLGARTDRYGDFMDVSAAVTGHVDVWVSTSRLVRTEADAAGYTQAVAAAGARIVVDTCTYVTPVLHPSTRVVMTNSGKWAHYAPGNIGVDVVFGSLDECVRSARRGRVSRDDEMWH